MSGKGWGQTGPSSTKRDELCLREAPLPEDPNIAGQMALVIHTLVTLAGPRRSWPADRGTGSADDAMLRKPGRGNACGGSLRRPLEGL